MDHVIQNSIQHSTVFDQVPVTTGCNLDIVEYFLDDEIMTKWCKSDELSIKFGLDGRCSIKFADQCIKNKICQNF